MRPCPRGMPRASEQLPPFFEKCRPDTAKNATHPVMVNERLATITEKLMATLSREVLDARDARVILGILQNLANTGPYVLGGVSYTSAELAALFQSRIDSGRKVDATRAAWAKAVQDDRAISKKVDAAYLGLREILRQRYDNAPGPLGEFGIAPKKVVTLDPLTQLVAAEKRRATRKARHTLGPKQRLKIKGVLAPGELSAQVIAEVQAVALPPVVPAAGQWLSPYVAPAGGNR
jgi:hypothetical protein